MTTVNVRRPSPLQRRVLIVLAALGAKRPGPVATRDIGAGAGAGRRCPVYGPNLRASLPAHGSRGLAAHPAGAGICSWLSN